MRKTHQRLNQTIDSYFDRIQGSGLATITLATMINIENGVRKLKKSILSGFKDEETYARTKEYKIKNKHRIRIA